MIQDLGVLTWSAGLLAQCDRGTRGLGFMSDMVGSRWQLWPGDLSIEAVARGYLRVWVMTGGLKQWGWISCEALTRYCIRTGMTGGLEHLGGGKYHDSNPARWPGDLKIKDLTGGLNSCFGFSKMTGGPNKWLVNILMTGGLGQTSCDWGTLIFLMDSLNS